ncbi:LysR family transcriptional regulator [Catenulispora sp. NF23]|uniref:LysR family transcriptional regulator n=1 Tax=Catenulispora pinistramenti TaxID=2705254 RepID=A0ABS5KHT9_9ACTN|nr:LysR substrate-binding domain-containing protein [Catenulispora pinistramenti]MBS2531157.1 LysR family transcriptional regulator [Catenulispora pinistramenti]MBS2545919.1 LysR family transcriptional regulator [Catenulispora pinistramenti]
MDVHLRDLRYFVTVAEELSFTRAAELLYMSQPALSKQIRQLELTMRVTLLRRDSQGTALTAAGAVLLPVARRTLERWDDASPGVLAAGASERRVLRVGLQSSIGRGLYPALLERFSRLQPDWRVELKLCGWTEPCAGLLKRNVDVALVWMPVPAGVRTRILLSEPRWVALPSGHHLADQVAVDFAALLDEPFIALPRSAGAAREFWLAGCERAGKPPHIALEAANPDESFEAIAAGLGVRLLPAGDAAVYARPGIAFSAVPDLTECQLAVAWRHDDQRPEVRNFTMACVQAAAAILTPSTGG